MATLRTLLSCGMLIVAAAMPAEPANAGSTERVSVATGAQATNGSSDPSISADGRFVAFHSIATNLVAGDTNARDDIFVRDRVAGLTRRVSVGPAGAQANGHSREAAISANGRYVAFTSDATNLVADDTNLRPDIFVHDRQTGATTRVSLDSAEAQVNDSSEYPSISADGRFVAFASTATNLVAGDTNSFKDVFVRDRVAGTTTRVSIATGGAQATGGRSENPAISSNGRFVAFQSFAANLVSGDTNSEWDIFVHDRQLAATDRVNLDSLENQATGDQSYDASISQDGRFVAFTSETANLVAGDTNNQADNFVRDRVAGTTQRVSVATGGAQATGGSSYNPSISADGRFVAFRSIATNLVPGDTNGDDDIFVRDRLAGKTELASISWYGSHGTNRSLAPAISGNGRFVAFWSFANLVAADTNNASDVYVRDRSSSRNDLLADFGAAGLLRRLNNAGAWAKIHNSSPLAIAAGNLDGGDKDEAIASFAGLGLLARYNNSGAWVRLHPAAAARFVTGDLNGTLKDEIIVDFGASGIYARYDDFPPWVRLRASTSQALAVGDFDGNGMDDLLADLSTGLWVRVNDAATWVRLHPTSPTFIATGDLDGNGKDEVIAAFAGGVFARYNNTGPFVRLIAAVAQGLATGDLDGNGKAELLVDLGAGGLSARYNNAGAFVRLHATNPVRILTADLDRNGKFEAIASFPRIGLYARYNNAGAFVRLSPLIEQGIVAGGFD